MRWRVVAVAALSLAPLPAAADVTARYQVGGAELSVEVDDGGDYRLEMAGAFALIRRGGVEYVVVFDGLKPCVFERQPFLDLVKAEFVKHKPIPTGERRDLILAKAGEEQVGERRGTLWTLQVPRAGANRIEAVMSDDPDLAPVAGILAETVDLALQNFKGFIPDSNLDTALQQLFTKGAPLRLVLMEEFRLGSVSTAPISPARFELPGVVLDPAMLRTLGVKSPKTRVETKRVP